ncbi:hypothetical protein Poli38472_008250 [Pythium oligandrum]|uniref:Cytochrome P450 n=1 Tax=Pythium oligandrum TaxID=41045 RepID=A0A8K1FPG6_PYTOL|nr:hypothetical protein Poli38472_008250 [Pythium oligandrum]|eukprot:TMW65608.1 hypothetical protein Poli38472_008250 [Pythium oligandrum]
MDRLTENPKLPLLAGTALAAAALMIHTLCQPKHKAHYRELEQPDSTLPVVGNFLDIAGRVDDYHDWILEQTLRFEGRPWKLTMPGQGEAIVVSSPDAIEEVMSTQFENFGKGPYQCELLREFFGYAFGTDDGELWYHQRKVAVKFFSTKTLDLFMRESIHKGVLRVQNEIEAATNKDEIINLRMLFQDFTLDTFIEMGLGVDLESVGAKTRHPVHEALEATSKIIFERFRNPAWVWKFMRWANVGHERELRRHMEVVNNWMHEMIQHGVEQSIQKKQRCVDISQNGVEPKQNYKSVLDLFLESPEGEAEGFTKDHLSDFILSLVVGATDSTADTLTWIFYALHKNPDVEKRLREEMETVLSGVDTTTYLTMEHLKPLVYLEAVIKETLRVYPAGPNTFREAKLDTIICGDIFVRKGQQVMTPQYAMGRNPAVWGPDATEFRPERWINLETGKLKPISASKFFSFSAGPRICPGMSLAMMELRIMVANLMHRYRFEVDPSVDGTYTMGVTLLMKQPLRVKAISLGG